MTNLIEVSVASIVMVVGILGCLQLQTKSLILTKQAHDYTVSSIKVDSMINQWRTQGNKGCKEFTHERVTIGVCN